MPPNPPPVAHIKPPPAPPVGPPPNRVTIAGHDLALRRLQAQPGDLLVLKVARPLPAEHMEAIRAYLYQYLPSEVGIFFIDEAVEMRLLRPEPITQEEAQALKEQAVQDG